MSPRGHARARRGLRRMAMPAAAAAVCAALALPAIALAASAADLEAKVREDAARASQFGRASAGTAPPAATPTGAAGQICLLGVCTQGAPKRADAVPGWFVLDRRSFALAMLGDFVNAGNCLDASQTRKELAAMPAPRDAGERQRQDRKRADLDKKLQETVKRLQGVDCAKYT